MPHAHLPAHRPTSGATVAARPCAATSRGHKDGDNLTVFQRGAGHGFAMSRATQARTSAAEVRGHGGAAAPGQAVRDEQTCGRRGQGCRQTPRSAPGSLARTGRFRCTLRSDGQRNWLPPRWPYVLVTMFAAFVSCGFATGGLPGARVSRRNAGRGARGRELRGRGAPDGCEPPASRRASPPPWPSSSCRCSCSASRSRAGRRLARCRGTSPSPACPSCVAGVTAAYLRRQPGVIFAAQLSVWSAANVVGRGSGPGRGPGVTAAACAVAPSRSWCAAQQDRRATAQGGAAPGPPTRVPTRARDDSQPTTPKAARRRSPPAGGAGKRRSRRPRTAGRRWRRPTAASQAPSSA